MLWLRSRAHNILKHHPSKCLINILNVSYPLFPLHLSEFFGNSSHLHCFQYIPKYVQERTSRFHEQSAHTDEEIKCSDTFLFLVKTWTKVRWHKGTAEMEQTKKWTLIQKIKVELESMTKMSNRTCIWFPYLDPSKSILNCMRLFWLFNCSCF